MNGFFLLLPLLLIRYGLLYMANREAMRRAAFFPPMAGKERIALVLYQLSTVVIFVYMCFLRVNAVWAWFYPGLAVYAIGILLLAISTVNFALPSAQGVSRRGLYKFSRNPMYVAYFIYFLGCVLLTRSIPLFLLLSVFQISSHWIILSEERWCEKELGDAYVQYAKSVRRYI